MPARSDLTTDESVLSDLLDVRRATAYFARILNGIADEELTAPSLLEGWNRSHVIAHVGYNARALGRLALWANTGVEHAMYASPETRSTEIARGATLLPHALRHLFEHSAVSLNVEWRDTPNRAWQYVVRTAQGRELPFSETPWLRTRELWVHAMDLDSGAVWSDVPAHIARRLIVDVAAVWKTRGEGRGIVLCTPDGDVCVDLSEQRESHTIVRGELADLLAWTTGRARVAVRARIRVEREDGASDALAFEAPAWV